MDWITYNKRFKEYLRQHPLYILVSWSYNQLKRLLKLNIKLNNTKEKG